MLGLDSLTALSGQANDVAGFVSNADWGDQLVALGKKSPVFADEIAEFFKKLREPLNAVGNKAKGLWDAFQGWILSLVDKFGGGHQSETQKAAVVQVQAKKPAFASLANSLLGTGEDATALGEDLLKECETSIRDGFGFLGMSKEPEAIIKQAMDLHDRLYSRVYESLLKKHGTKISDDQASAIAHASAAAISGLDLDILRQDKPELRFLANPPTKGIGGMLFAMQKGLSEKNGPAPVVPALEFDASMLSAVNADIKKIGAPEQAPPTPDPKAAALDQAVTAFLQEANARGWRNKDGTALTLEGYKAILPEGFTFAKLDTNSDNVLSRNEFSKPLVDAKRSASGI